MIAQLFRRSTLLFGIAATSACSRSPEPPPPVAAPVAPAPQPPVAAVAAPAPAVEIVAAPPGEVTAIIAQRLPKLRDGQTLLVDVGASWCEPCQRLHEAARSGRLDREFPGLVLLEFDFDRDQDRLAAAGYTSKLLPLLALPGPDGRMGPRMLQGSVKGQFALEGNLLPRLHDLLSGRPVD